MSSVKATRSDEIMKPGAIYEHLASNFPAPKQGNLRVCWIPQIPGKAFFWPVADFAQAALLLDALAAYDDFQYGEHIKLDYSNAGDLEIYHNGEWETWESDDCDDFRTYRDLEMEKDNG
jgi:hypothetical protein